MGSGKSGLYAKTRGTKAPSPTSKLDLSSRVASWAHRQMRNMSNRQRAKFNTACVVIDETTGKRFYGRNNGIALSGAKRNPQLFGDKNQAGLLPTTSLNRRLTVGRCAEVDAVNKALNAGAKLEHLTMMTIHTTDGSAFKFGDGKPACENCTHAFREKIKRNHSGWKE